MAENFKVEAEFVWKTNATEVLGTLTRGFRDLIELSDRLKQAFETIDAGGLSKLSSALKKLQSFAMPDAAMSSLRETVSGMDKVAEAAGKASAAAKEVADAVKSIPKVEIPRIEPGASTPRVIPSTPDPGASPRPAPTLTHALSGATDIYFGGQMAAGAAGALMAPSYDLAKSRTQLLANNTPEQADAAIQSAQDMQRKVRGTDVQGNIEVYRQLFSLTQNAEEARALMPSFLPSGVAMATFNPDAGDYSHQLEAVTKSAEFKGMLSSIDPKTGKAQVNAAGALHMGDLLLAMQVVSKGAVGSDTFLKFLRSSGSAGANMDLSEVPYLIPIIQALGPSRAGTGLSGLESQFSSGKMSNAAVDMMQDMGILSRDPKLYRKLGMGMFMLKPGAIKEKQFREAVFHPREFINDVLEPQVQKYNTKNYGKAYTGADADQRRVMDSATMQQLASRIPGGGFMSEILRNELLSERDNAAYGKLDPAAIKKTMADSPQVAVESFSGSLKNLMGVLGGAPFKDAIGVLNTFTGTMNALSSAAQKHPAAAATVSTAAVDAGLGAALTVTTAAASKLLPKAIGTPLALAGGTAGKLMMVTAAAEVAAGVLEGVASWADSKMSWAAALDRKLSEALHGMFGGGAVKAPVHKESYETSGPTHMQPIHVSLMLPDGRVLARSVTEHMAREDRAGSRQGMHDPDYRAIPFPAGLRSA